MRGMELLVVGGEMLLYPAQHPNLRRRDECSLNNMITNMPLLVSIHNHRDLVPHTLLDPLKAIRTLPNHPMEDMRRSSSITPLNDSIKNPLLQILVTFMLGTTHTRIPAATTSNNNASCQIETR
jgi:hypothetical protein